MLSSKSTSRLMTSGNTSGGIACGSGGGMSSLTACVWIGSVMIRGTSSTSMMSINGVVLMSNITPDFSASTLLDFTTTTAPYCGCVLLSMLINALQYDRVR